MTTNHSHALAFFGTTGDLAYKKVFPALQAMVKRGHLNVRVIAVANADWNFRYFSSGRRIALRNMAESILQL